MNGVTVAAPLIFVNSLVKIKIIDFKNSIFLLTNLLLLIGKYWY